MDSVLYDSPSSFLKHLTWSPWTMESGERRVIKEAGTAFLTRHCWRPAPCPLGLCNLRKASAFLSPAALFSDYFLVEQFLWCSCSPFFLRAHH